MLLLIQLFLEFLNLLHRELLQCPRNVNLLENLILDLLLPSEPRVADLAEQISQVLILLYDGDICHEIERLLCI
jgi:hypothetical protein